MQTAHALPVVFECHACERIEHRRRPILPLGWDSIVIDGEAHALCEDCATGEDPADNGADPLIDDAEHLEAQAMVEEIRRFCDRRVMPALLSTIAVFLAISITAQISAHLA